MFTQQGIDHNENVRSAPSPVGNTPTPMRKPLLSGPDQGRPSQIYDAVVPGTVVLPARPGYRHNQGHRRRHRPIRDVLAAETTTIGKAYTAHIRVKGWFKPDVAAAIARRGDAFTITIRYGAACR